MRVVVSRHPGHAEVAQLDVAGLVNQQVGGLDIAVDDAFAMRMVQRRKQPAHHDKDSLQREGIASLDLLVKVVAFHQFHHQVSDAFVAVGVENTNDVVVLQQAGGTPFGQEALLQFLGLLLRHVGDQDRLDGDATCDIRIERLIHRTHTAAADQLDDLIATKALGVNHELNCFRFVAIGRDSRAQAEFSSDLASS